MFVEISTYQHNTIISVTRRLLPENKVSWDKNKRFPLTFSGIRILPAWWIPHHRPNQTDLYSVSVKQGEENILVSK